ncbi:TIGR01777 family oxidoreductase [Pinibacter aurantiacus]|uniref:TIGR01777 family oxidoreductase n=1 Tax=Pinibacter aurantiacus TaxID=2851599 RepID=A0A9E2SE94_9BACT|nr:TIGR01777 family oxidoreductase [Pinibacter aurantiacus]MBV4359887.1 TIGR01777 family oxidoreductase [Pinibacter aurantiacus]
METILITGGTGLIGKRLTSLLLQNGYSVIVLTRNKIEASENFKLEDPQSTGYHNLSFAEWNVKEQTIDRTAVEKADYIIHLAGAGVADKRWSDKRKKEIAESRTKSGALIVKALSENSHHVKAVVSASAIGWYGPDPSVPNLKPFVESDEPNDDFLGQTCLQWEQSIEPVQKMNVRLVKLRTGIVLSNEGGALEEFRKPLRFGLSTILGSGSQVVSWIHIDDLCRMYMQAMHDEKMQGAYNAVATHPISNKKLNETLAVKQRGRFYIPIYVPSFVLKMVLGEMSIEVLKSTTVSNEKMRKAGFQFIFPDVEKAIADLINN